MKSHTEIFICFLLSLMFPNYAINYWGRSTLPSNLVQKIHDDFVLGDTHTVEMFSHSVRQLFLALPALFLPTCHCRGHMTYRRSGQGKLIVWLLEGSRGVQMIIVSITV